MRPLTVPEILLPISELDVETLERAGEALIRSGNTQTAIEVFALALRLRSETGLHPQRRSDDR